MGLFKKELAEEKKVHFKIELTPEIPALPEIQDEKNFDVRYPLISPYAYAHISYNAKENELMYILEEPSLNEEEKQILKTLEEGLSELVNISTINMKSTETIIEYLEKNVNLLLNEFGIKISDETFLKIMYYLYRDFVGLNEIEPLLKDYFIEDIECNGIKTPIYIVHRKYRNLKTNIVYNELNELTNFVEKLAQKSGKYISYANPLLDGQLPDGSIDYDEPFIYKEKGIIKVSKIGEVINKFYNKESNIPIKVKDIEVPAFDLKTLKISWKKVDYVYKHRINDNIYEVSSEFGRKIRLTGCHSLFVLTKNGVESKRTDKLKENDYAVIPLKLPEHGFIKKINVAEEISKTGYAKELILDNIPPLIFLEKKQEIKEYLNKNYKRPYQSYYDLKTKKILPLPLYTLLEENTLKKCKIRPTSAIGIPTFLEVNTNLVRFLGLYMAEGWLYRNSSNASGVYFSLNKKEKDLIRTLKKSAKECFGLDIYIEPEDKNAVKVKLTSYALWILLNEVLEISKGAKNKRVPVLIFNLNKELQQEFLRYWNLGDYGSSASKQLANDVSYLSLFNEDIVAFYSRNRKSLFGQTREVKSHEYYTNFFARNCYNPYSSMIPTIQFNPLKETNFELKNKRIGRKRFRKLLSDLRYHRFRNIENVNSIKFIKEWNKRGFIEKCKLSEKGKELIKEIDIVKKLIDSDLGFAKIKSIKKIKPSREFVYDVSVKDCENFIGGYGGMCCHNSRVNATYTQEISAHGPSFSIRKFTKEPWTPIKLIDLKTVSPELLAFLWILIENESNIMIIGGTGAGKTSFLNAIAFFIPPASRIVSVEDTREINLLHENWLPSVARESTLEGKGEIDLFTLLRESFRQRPDYVIVGEIRGKEGFVMFQAMASGHPTFGTMHAEDVETMIRRLESPPIELSPSLVASLDAVCIIAQTKVLDKEVRRLKEIVEIVEVEKDKLTLNKPFVWDPKNDMFYFKTDSKIFDKIALHRGINKEKLQREFNLRSQLLLKMYHNKIFGFKEVNDIIAGYYKNPLEVLKRFNVQ